MERKGRSHPLGVQEQWFEAIRCGKKTVEGRLWNDKRKEIKVNDTIEFTCGEKKLTVVVAKIVVYVGENALDKYIVGETLEKILPGVETLEEARKIYLMYLGEGTTDDEKMKSIDKIGMVGFHIVNARE
ncbi:MAG: ASCH domain-containing protein [Hyperionvirus sp.]|uniref:ASCH domain-containing protein n=1 Tax=Hyperionvirus sp. TaxID=2487770 RepID=A0A3G5A6J4_9VIRU|nr:MAG: ASCH domain-containing protein [Hyperionvirus sp.]